MYLPEHQKVDGVADVSVEIVHDKDERFSYPYDIHENNNDSSVNAAHFKLTPD